MALDNANSLSDPFPLSDALERVPESSPLRVSTNTLLESGIPPARMRAELTLEGGLEHLETALSSVYRTEANLGLLVRGLKQLATGALAARDANAELMLELDELRAQLTQRHEQEQAARFRTSQLEQLLDVIRHESTRERQFLLEQQDAFLLEILNDHERQVDALRDAVQAASTRTIATRQIAELTAQRDQAREYATRCERERDLAWHELATGEVRSAPSSEPAVTARRASPPPFPSRPTGSTLAQMGSRPAAAAIGSISLRSVTAPASAAPEAARSPERSGTSYSLPGSADDATE